MIEMVKSERKHFTYMDILITMSMILLFGLGWKIALGIFDYPTKNFFGTFESPFHIWNFFFSFNASDAAIYISLAFFGSLISFFLAYSCVTVRYFTNHNLDGTLSPHALFFYRIIVLVQSFCAGIMLNIIRLCPFKWPKQINNDGVFFLAMGISFTIILGTFLIRFLKPKIVLAFLPLTIFLTGVVISDFQYKAHTDPDIIIKNFSDTSSIIKILTSRILFGEAFDFIAFVLIFSAGLYIFTRPYVVFSLWKGKIAGCAFNGIIAIFLVLYPYLAKTPNKITLSNTIFSALEIFTLTKFTNIFAVYWFWIIGNIITIAPIFLGRLSSPKDNVTKSIHN